MTQDSRRIPPAPCPGDPHNCELLLRSQEAYHGRCAQAGNIRSRGGRERDGRRPGHRRLAERQAEDMHCGKRGPDDAAMFAESTSLHGRYGRTSGGFPIDSMYSKASFVAPSDSHHCSMSVPVPVPVPVSVAALPRSRARKPSRSPASLR